MLTTTGRVSAGVLATALLAGCGFADSSDARTSTSAPPADMHGAPRVPDPLATAEFQRNPCRTLTPGQVGELGVGDTRGEPDLAATGGPTCEWSDRFTGPSDSTTAVTYAVDSAGLKYLYSQRKVYEYFRPLASVGGYPALAAASLAPDTPSPERAGTCSVHVGVTNELFVTTQITTGEKSPHRTDPCGRAREVATEVVRTLKGSA